MHRILFSRNRIKKFVETNDDGDEATIGANKEDGPPRIAAGPSQRAKQLRSILKVGSTSLGGLTGRQLADEPDLSIAGGSSRLKSCWTDSIPASKVADDFSAGLLSGANRQTAEPRSSGQLFDEQIKCLKLLRQADELDGADDGQTEDDAGLSLAATGTTRRRSLVRFNEIPSVLEISYTN